MLKNAFLSIRKNIGKTVLLFVIMIVIANLIIAGLSIQSASEKSMDQIRSSLGNDVTLTTNMKNMMGQREKGQAISEVAASVTTDMADQLKALKYVENYNYTISTSANSDTITAVELTATDEGQSGGMQRPDGFGSMATNNQGDFSISANTTMAYLDTFSEEKSTLSEGRLLSVADVGTNNCVIETTLASDNDLSVGDTITLTATVNDETVNQELIIVGIYEVTDSQQMGGPGQSNPFNTIYTDLSIGNIFTGSDTNLSSATFYLDDPENIEAFQELAQNKTDIDFETYTLDANDRLYQQNVNSLENTQSFATMFLIVVIGAGSAVLCLILILTIRNRYYEIGVFLSLGQSKIKIILQQLLEMLMIACIAFVISLGTGKMVSNVVGNMLETGTSDNQVTMEMPAIGSQEMADDKQSEISNNNGRRPMFDDAFSGPENSELDVSLTATTVVQLAGITIAICLVSIAIPSAYVLRLSPREILVKKEG